MRAGARGCEHTPHAQTNTDTVTVYLLFLFLLLFASSSSSSSSSSPSRCVPRAQCKEKDLFLHRLGDTAFRIRGVEVQHIGRRCVITTGIAVSCSSPKPLVAVAVVVVGRGAKQGRDGCCCALLNKYTARKQRTHSCQLTLSPPPLFFLLLTLLTGQRIVEGHTRSDSRSRVKKALVLDEK